MFSNPMVFIFDSIDQFFKIGSTIVKITITIKKLQFSYYIRWDLLKNIDSLAMFSDPVIFILYTVDQCFEIGSTIAIINR